MTFRTTVRDGLIVINTHGAIPDGTPIEALAVRAPASKGSKGAKASRTAKRGARGEKSGALPLPGFGAWKHRKDIADTAQFARELRRRAIGVPQRSTVRDRRTPLSRG